MINIRSTYGIWWQAFRYHFIPPSMFPVMIGALVSLVNQQGFSLWYFTLVFFTVIINHIALNMTDDYFDYLHAVDQTVTGEKNPYSGGSGTLTSGVIKPKDMLYVFSFLYVIVVLVGIYLAYYRGWPVLIFGLIGVLSSIFYTAPPVKFSHHGLGELAMLFNFSFVLGVGSFYVQAQMISLEAIVATLPCGIMLFSMIIINEVPDIKEDTQAGKLTLIARFGPLFGIKLYILSWIVTYGVIISGVLISILPVYSILTFLSFPFVVRSIRILRIHYQQPQQLVQANVSMIIAHAITGLSLIISYALKAIQQGENITTLGFILVIFLLGYFPAALPLLLPQKE